VTSHGARHLIVDSTGLKLFGQGEWDEERHGRARRSWRKLHLAIDAGTGEIVANTLTDNGADDVGEVPGLLGQVEGEIISFIADGAYDGEPVYQAVVN
jgi:Transposase DDE domain